MFDDATFIILFSLEITAWLACTLAKNELQHPPQVTSVVYVWATRWQHVVFSVYTRVHVSVVNYVSILKGARLSFACSWVRVQQNAWPTRELVKLPMDGAVFTNQVSLSSLVVLVKMCPYHLRPVLHSPQLLPMPPPGTVWTVIYAVRLSVAATFCVFIITFVISSLQSTPPGSGSVVTLSPIISSVSTCTWHCM